MIMINRRGEGMRCFMYRGRPGNADKLRLNHCTMHNFFHV